MTHGGVRWKTTTCAAVRWSSGTNCAALAPVPMSKVLFANSGSEANDTQVKLVWYMNNALGRPRKKKIIARLRGYHGVTIASARRTPLTPHNLGGVRGVLDT